MRKAEQFVGPTSDVDAKTIALLAFLLEPHSDRRRHSRSRVIRCAIP